MKRTSVQAFLLAGAVSATPPSSIFGQANAPGAGSNASSTLRSTPALESGTKVVTLPIGTAIPIRLSSEVNTRTAKIGDTFRGTTASAVQFNGYTAIPTGTPVLGSVIDAKAGGRFSGAATLSIQLVSIRLAVRSGTEDIALATQPLSNQGTGKGGSTAARAGGGAALGALLGGVTGGGTGAIVGSAGGGALGAGSSGVTRGRQIDIKPEQLLQFTTAAPLDVAITLQNGQQVQTPASSETTLQTRPVPPQQ